MRQPYGTPNNGDVPIWNSAKNRSEWGAVSGGGDSAALNLLIGGGEILSGVPSYSNNGGTGDRRSLITVTASSGLFYVGNDPNDFVNGAIGSPDNIAFHGDPIAGKELRFTFTSPVLITEMKWYHGGGYSGDFAYWQVQASNDGTTWKYFPKFLWPLLPGGGSEILPTGLETNVFAYSIYRMFGLEGTASAGPYLNEMEFKIYGLGP